MGADEVDRQRPEGQVSRHEKSAREADLTAGYARVHKLELEALRLQRVGDDLLARGGTPAETRAALAERHAVASELAALRRRLDSHRNAG
jgi:hypothetical protein